ncbi:MAG: AAA family ATPase [Chloroflexi bacterium]|nr:AAA family ATPase [Chloroflexota bacterium]
MAALHIHLLGFPQIYYDGVLWPIPRRQARALLYRLAVDKTALTRTQIGLLFWPDVHDKKVRRALSHLLTHLRRALPEADIIWSEGNLLGLRDDVWVDTVAFTQLQEGSPEDWVKAEQLYRGSFLQGADLPATPEYELWALQEYQRWERAYLDLLARLIKETQTTQPETAIAYCQRYLELDPLAETIHVRLMQLYAATGARSAALRQYEICVTALERELGVNPSPSTRAAYDAILQVRSTAVVPVAEWSTLPSLQVPQIERDALMQELNHALTETVTRGQGHIFFISGEAGIGKSRLLQEFAATVSSRATVLYGASSPSRHPLPYQAITQALRGALDLPAMATVAPVWLAELSQLLPELHSHYPQLPSPRRRQERQAQLPLFEALSQVLNALASDRPLLLCLDDMHWADSATLAWLSYWGQHLRHVPVLTLLTYRPQEGAALQTLARSLARHASIRMLSLAGLSPAAIAQLLRYAGIRLVKKEQAQLLRTTTGGNPFFLLEIARALLERNQQQLPLTESEWPLPESVAQVIASRLVMLSPTAMQILEAGAILQDDFTFDAVQETAGRTELETMDGLDELVGRQLLTYKHNRYQFIHDLTRRVVLDRMSTPRQQWLHRRAGLALARRRDVAVDAIAQHFDVGGDAEKALTYYGQAAQRVAALYAWDAAESYYQRMLDLLAQMDPECHQQHCRHQYCRILIARAQMYYLQGRLTERDRDLTTLLELASVTQDAELRLQVLAARVRYLNLDGHYHEALKLVVEGLDLAKQIDAPSLHSRLYAQQGFAYYFLGQPRPALQALQAAAAVISGDSDPETQGRIAQFTGYVYYHLAQYDQALSQHQRAYRCHQVVEDRNRMAWDLTDMGIMCMQMQRLEEAEAHLQASLNLAREIASQPAESYALNNLGRLYALRGNYGEALRCHETSLQLQRTTGSKRGEAAALIFAAQAHLGLAETEKAGRLLPKALDICRTIGYQLGQVEALATLAATQRQDASQAVATAQAALSLAQKIEAPYYEIWALLILAELYHQAGEDAQAQKYNQAVRARAESLGWDQKAVRQQLWFIPGDHS